MMAFYGLLGGCMLAVAFSAVWALAWARRNGQLSGFQQAAATIFDQAEPEGQMTDFVLGKKGADQRRTSSGQRS